jgi:hypothetical protein
MALEREQLNFNRSSRGGGGSSYGYSGGGSDGGSGYQSTKTGSTTTGMSKETIDSIKSSGIGPVSQQGLANAVAEGKVSTYNNANGNTIVTKNKSESLAYSPVGKALIADSKKKEQSTVSKVVNWVKGLFK